jgi:hypothetical protein
MSDHPASWKDLCIDAVDPLLLGRFWADTLGLELQQREDDGMVYLTGPTPHHTVWVNRVSEPVTVKQRVHLDVHASTVDEVLGRGATPYDLDSFAWKVLRDPEGGELCVFERDEVPDNRLYELGVDCAEPRELGAWWAEVIGGRYEYDEEQGWASVGDIPGAPFEGIVFAEVPEPKTVKNRIHWDVEVGSVEELTAHGARVLREPDDEIRWTILADPEGNEFCAFTPVSPG